LPLTEHLKLQGGDRLIVLSDDMGIALIRAEIFDEMMKKVMAEARQQGD
jgi:hypothetical protein